MPSTLNETFFFSSHPTRLWCIKWQKVMFDFFFSFVHFQFSLNWIFNQWSSLPGHEIKCLKLANCMPVCIRIRAFIQNSNGRKHKTKIRRRKKSIWFARKKNYFIHVFVDRPREVEKVQCTARCRTELFIAQPIVLYSSSSCRPSSIQHVRRSPIVGFIRLNNKNRLCFSRIFSPPPPFC